MIKNITIKIYNTLFIIILPFLFLRLFLKSLKLAGYRQRWQERLGILPNIHLNNVIWVHAVSVGEIMAALPIIHDIQQGLPNNNVVVTCTTPAGSYILKTKNIIHFYLPFDINFAVNNFLSKIKPRLLILLEKEIWPNIITNCYKNNIPIMIANAQLSNKSLHRYLLVKPLIANLLKKIKYICAQTKFDAYKFQKIINNNNNIMVVGNTKFDLQIHIEKTIITSITRPIWIAASTHPGEEELILQAHQTILTKIPNALLILAPRHVERSIEILKNIKNFSVVAHSQHRQQAIAPNIQVYMVDSIGELNLFYSMSQIAFVGGSLVPIGGHNVLEPAALAVPVVVGPYTISCKQIVAKMKYADGLLVVKNPEELSKVIIKLFNDKTLCEKIGNNAKMFLHSQVGASKKIADLAIGLVI